MRIGLIEFLLILAIASLTIGPQVALFVDRWMRRANRANARAARRRAEYAAQMAVERDALLKRFRTASTVFGVCILLALVFIAMLGFGKYNVILALGVAFIPSFARVVRAEFARHRSMNYVKSARLMGASHLRIIFRHILPNCISVIIITTALQIPSAIFTESYLSFIGMGVRAPMPSLGSLANYARDGLQSYPYKLVFPALTICLIVLSMNLLGDGLRDAFDPKLKR